MRKDLGKKSWVFPMPVLILGTYDENGVANAMNAAWGGMYDFNKITVSLSEHKTTANMRLKKGLTISFATKDTIAASDYVGIVSAKDVPNKVEKAGLHPFKSKFVDAPLFVEYPVTLECKIESFEEGTLVAEIVNVSVDEKVLKGDKIDFEKAGFVAFDPANGKYRIVGEEIADAFKIGFTLK
ncbi:MAG: flavin reductase [Candidatus Enteromonas sp.]|nr:flavin reductase [Candidatus Enteromonas sp.]